jgi:hypothetical protein
MEIKYLEIESLILRDMEDQLSQAEADKANNRVDSLKYRIDVIIMFCDNLKAFLRLKFNELKT